MTQFITEYRDFLQGFFCGILITAGLLQIEESFKKRFTITRIDKSQ